MGFFNFSPHKYTISLPLFLSQLCLSPSLFVYILVFLCALFSSLLLLLWVRSQLPSAFSALCVSPPPFCFFFSFFYVTPHLAFRNVELTFAHKKETYNVEHVLLRFCFFWARFSPKRKTKKKKKISPVKVAKRQSFPFQFSVSLCHCVSSIILTCFTICRALRSMFYVCFLYSMYLCLSVSLSLSLSLLYRWTRSKVFIAVNDIMISFHFVSTSISLKLSTESWVQK